MAWSLDSANAVRVDRHEPDDRGKRGRYRLRRHPAERAGRAGAGAGHRRGCRRAHRSATRATGRTVRLLVAGRRAQLHSASTGPVGVRFHDAGERNEDEERRYRLRQDRSEEHTSELQSLMRISYAVFCLKNKTNKMRKQQTKPKLKLTH